MKRTIIIIVAFFATLEGQAQEATSTFDQQAAQNTISSKPGKSKFMLRGFFFTGFDAISKNGESESNFIGGGINPVLLYKQSDKLFFEAEFEGEYSHDGGFELGLGYANVSYVLNKYMTIRAGKFLIPYGTFVEKFHPSWINRMASAPLGFSHHDGMAPTADVGVELRGAFYTGSVKLNYQAYIINGSQLNDGSDEPGEGGMLKFGYMPDNNKNKTVGGRIGILPFSNQMLEIGFSGMTGVVGSSGSLYQGIKANLFSVDLSLVKNLNFMKSVVDIKGQYNYTKVDDAYYLNPEDAGDLFTTYNNVSDAYYAQLSIRPSLVENKILRNLEVVGRYSTFQTPEGALWEQNPTQIAVGLNYWIDWRTVIKLGYQSTDGLGGDGHGDHDSGEEGTENMFYIRWAMGF